MPPREHRMDGLDRNDFRPTRSPTAARSSRVARLRWGKWILLPVMGGRISSGS
jgi:hypothetical protein